VNSRLSSFLTELKRRHVLRAVAVYAAVAFVVLQAGEIILPAFEAPVWILQLLVVLAVVGFPLVVVVAWVYALTPRGLERTDALDAEAGLEIDRSVLPPVALAVTSLVVIGVAGLWFVRQPEVGAAQAPPLSAVSFAADPSEAITSLAVLPLDDFSDSQEADYFAASMHEALIARLSQLDALRVVSRTSVNQYAETDKSAPQIGAELGVQGIVEGSVTRVDGRVRITLQLIHAASDTHLWANSYDRDLSDVLTLQAEVANEVAQAIQGEVEASVQQIALGPVNPEAHDAFMRGQYERNLGTPEALQAAEVDFAEAVRIDSTFAPAVAGLAGTRFLLGLHDENTSPERLVEVREGAVRALALDASSDEARAVLIAVDERLAGLGEDLQLMFDNEDLRIVFDEEASADSLEREYLRRFTDFGRATQVVMIRGEPEDADHAHSWQWRIGAAQKLMEDGEYEEGIALLQGVVESTPELSAGWDALERSYSVRGDFDMAVETRKDRVRETSASQQEAEAAVQELEQAIRTDGQEGYWEWIRDDHQNRRSRGEYASDIEYAAACVALGEHEDALASLETGLANRDRGLITLRSDPVWDPLRKEPRFKAVLSQVRRRGPRGAAANVRPKRPSGSN
jgi:adenylate cyclase